MIQIKKTILTLVALLALTTQAWAQGKLIYEKVFTSDTQYPFYLDAADKTGASATVSGGMLVLNNPTIQTQNWDVQPEIGRLTSATPITKGNTYRVVMQYKTTKAGGVTFALGGQDWTNTDWRGQSITVSDDFQTCEGYFDSFPYSNAESHILLQFGSLVATITIKKVEVYELYPFDGISWDKTTHTATIAEMPSGNVVVTPEYYDQAAFATDPTAINDVPATTDGAIVKAGTVANIGSTETAQGTVMYHLSKTELTDAQLLALTDADWSKDVPTAETFTAQGTAYVYYYIKGNEGQTDDDTFSDGDIQLVQVPVGDAPTFAVTFAEGIDEADKWTASPNTGLKKGDQVTVKYTGTKKVLGVKAEKKAAAAATVTIAGVELNVESGQNWETIVANNSGKIYLDGNNYVRLTANDTYLFYNGSPAYKTSGYSTTGTYQWLKVLDIEGAKIYYQEGETWNTAISAGRLLNENWLIDSNLVKCEGHGTLYDGDAVSPSAIINASHEYEFY